MDRGHHAIATAAAAAAVIVLLLGFAAWAKAGRPGPDRPTPSMVGQRASGIWVQHRWVGEGHNDTDYQAFVARLRAAHLTDAFFHVGPLEKGGGIPAARYPHARELAATMHRLAPEIRVQAYIGQVRGKGAHLVDTDDPATRQGIVDQAKVFLDDGFDGIQVDIEPVGDNDQGFLAAMGMLHDLTRSRGAVLSVAVPMLKFSGVEGTPMAQIGNGPLWSPAYMQAMGDRVDQINVMAYLAPFHDEAQFSTMVAWQTTHLAALLTGRAQLQVGVPTYEEDQPAEENVHSALAGVKQGLSQLPPEQAATVGIAVFAEWTTFDAKWTELANEWPPA